jgi:hypothetical protein
MMMTNHTDVPYTGPTTDGPKQRKLKIYYAHPMSWYNTPAERADVAMLEAHGEVVNPNSKPFEYMVGVSRAERRPVMEIFADYIKNNADVVAFRPFYDGKLGAGVAREVFEALIWRKPIWHIFGKNGRGPFVDQYPELSPGVYPAAIDWDDVLTVKETKARIARGAL